MKRKTFIKLKKAIAILTIIAFFIQPSLLAFASETVATPDPNQGKNPIVEQSANGTTVVNIREPNKNGLSHNQYLDLQIGQNGIIFNNSSNISNTQLGGLIHGNMYAGPGGAKIILNEVTGHLPTNINGYMEVAGNKADLIIANPNGIVGNNFGFINTNRAVLTTGNPLIDNGKLNGFNVTGGEIAINGNGMDASTTSKTDLVAKVVKINATVNAQNLNIITGKNKVGYDGSVTAYSDQETGVGLDVSALGSMYSNRITLVGTGKGVGVNSVGNISAVGGDLILNQNGQIVLKGDTYAKTNISMVSNQDIIQEGTLYAKGNINLQTDKNIQNNSGIIKADNNLAMNATNQINNNNGQIGAGNNLTLTGQTINNQNTLISNAGQGTFTINATTLNNSGGKLLSDGSLNMNVQNITNSSGLLYSAISTQVVAGSLTGDGQILSTGNINLKVDNGFTNNNKVQANGSITIISQNNITNNQDILAGQNVTLTAQNITNQGSILANNNLNLTAQNTLTNNKDIKAANTLNITVGDLNNQQLGTLLADNVLIKATNDLDNKGLINASFTYLQADTINNINTGRIYGDNIALKAINLNNIGNSTLDPVIAARNQLNIGAQNITNKEHAILLSEGDMYIGGDLDNSNAVIGSANELNNNSATIEAGQNLVINSDVINNTNDHFEMELVEIEREHFTEYQGSGQSQKYLAGTAGVYIFNDQSDHLMVHGRRFEQWNAYRYYIIKKQDQITLTDPGKILSGQTMLINSNTLNNDKSKIVAGGSFLGNIGTLNNIEADGRTVYVTTGTVTSYWRKHLSGHDTTGSSSSGYNPASVVENLIVDASTYQQNTAPPTSGQDAGSYTQQDNDQQVTEGNGPITIPGGGLFGQAKDPDANYIIETDPNFTNYKKWASSDYFFEKMQYDPERILKRLGDAYYEQKLIKDQIIQLTSNRYLDGFDNDDTQYMALMDSAVQFANNSDAIVGVALNKEQLDGLTESIVWMIEKEVILPTGEIVKALVPQVYLVEKDKQSTGSAVISAKDVDLNLSNDLVNAGTIKATNSIEVSATNINNLGGVLSGKDISLEAREDINNIGGKIIADNSINLTAGRDVNIESTTNTQTNAQGHTTNLGSLSVVHVKGEKTIDPNGNEINTGTININAENDINLKAGVVINDGDEGRTTLEASNDINISTVELSNSNNIKWDDKNKRSDSSTTDSGSYIHSGNNLEIIAGNDVNAKAAYVTSDKELVVNAGNDINITAGRETSDVVEDHKNKGKSGGGSSQTVTTHDELQENLSISSSFSGESIKMNAGNDVNIVASNLTAENELTIQAGNDITIEGQQDYTESLNTYDKKSKGLLSKKSTNIYDEKESTQVVSSYLSGGSITLESGNNTNILASTVVADNDININAGGDINIQSQEQEDYQYYNKEEKRSGFMSGGLGFTIGKEQKKDKYINQNTEQVGSSVGSLEGNININAGRDVNIKASDIIAKEDINIEGNSVNITSEEHISSYQEKHEYKKTGLTISLGGDLISAIESVYKPIERANQVSDSRLQTLNYVKTGIAIEESITKLAIINKHNQAIQDNVKTIQGMMEKGEISQALGQKEIDRNNSEKINIADAFEINISLGTTKWKTETTGNTVISQGSTINAEGNVTIVAREKDINIQGSNISGENVTLKAQENVNIEASANTNTHREDSSSSSSSIGVNLNLGGGISGGFNSSKSKGEVNQNGTTWNESTITAKNELTIETGNDLNIIGSQVIGEKVQVDVGGDLNIETLQDTDNYHEKNKNSSVGVTVGYGSINISGSKGKQEIDSKYESNQEQAGIFAGEGGFDIYVEGNTDLKGGVISSKADENKNTISTGTISFENIENKSEYDAKQSSSGFDTSALSGGNIIETIGGNHITSGSSNGSASGVTESAISEGTIEIRDPNNQEQDIEDLSRDTENANGRVDNIFDLNEIKEDLEYQEELQKLIEQQVGKQIIKGSKDDDKLTPGEANEAGKTNHDEDDAQQKVKDGNYYYEDPDGNITYYDLNNEPDMSFEQLVMAAKTTGSALIMVAGVVTVGGVSYRIVGGLAYRVIGTTATGTTASVADKLNRYLLNPTHVEGGPKAKWFEQALGFTRTNANELAKQIVFNPNTAVQTTVTQYGTKYNQVISVHGANGRVIDVTFAWIRNNDGVVRLVSAIPTKK